jgi:cation transport protein ChaC
MLTRQSIASGQYLDSFEHLPVNLRWSVERIAQSMADTLRAKPEGGAIWVFAYGSLLWNPLLEFVERQRATLIGWHRSFCLRMVAGRAHPDAPGRMLAVEPGGVTQGAAFRLDDQHATEELRLMWIREMVTGAYAPTWSPVTLGDGSTVLAIVFVANPSRPQYEADASVDAIAPMIGVARGQHGSNADYVFQLQAALRELGAHDSYVDALATALQRILRSFSPTQTSFDTQGDSYVRKS